VGEHNGRSCVGHDGGRSIEPGVGSDVFEQVLGRGPLVFGGVDLVPHRRRLVLARQHGDVAVERRREQRGLAVG